VQLRRLLMVLAVCTKLWEKWTKTAGISFLQLVQSNLRQRDEVDYTNMFSAFCMLGIWSAYLFLQP